MKKIEAIVRPSRFENIKDALCKYNVYGLTVTEVTGCGLQKGKKEVYRGTEYTIDLLAKVKVELVVPDGVVSELIGILTEAGRTGEIGDGKIFVSSVENVIRIRTGEAGEAAILPGS